MQVVEYEIPLYFLSGFSRWCHAIGIMCITSQEWNRSSQANNLDNKSYGAPFTIEGMNSKQNATIHSLTITDRNAR